MSSPQSCDRARKFLLDLERGDLHRLLEHATYVVLVESPDDWIPTTRLRLFAPAPYDEALKGLVNFDKDRIVEAIHKTEPSLAGEDRPSLSIATDAEHALPDEQRLFGDIVVERNMLIDVGTGGTRIESVNDHYRTRRKRVHRLLASMGLDDPNPFESLWDWYKHYSAEIGAYKDRRRFIRIMYEPLLERLSAKMVEPAPAREPTGWDRVDRTLEKARASTMRGAKEEDFQAIGLLCREVLISLAQAVFIPGRHESLDGVKPSDTDAKRMLEAFFATELAGSDLEAARKHARAALDLAVALQHKRTATFRFAALCLEGTSSVVNTVAIVSGRRDAAVPAQSSTT